MLVFTGHGYLGILIPVLGGATGTMIGTSFPHANADLFTCVSIFVASFFTWWVGRSLNNPQKAKVLIDKKTGLELLVPPHHSLFWIKLQYWAFITGFSGLGMIYHVAKYGSLAPTP
jgi:hypothetical protein